MEGMEEKKTAVPESKTYAQLKLQLILDPSTSFWMKNAINTLERRDPLDAVSDVEVLLSLMQMRADEVLHLGGLERRRA